MTPTATRHLVPPTIDPSVDPAMGYRPDPLGRLGVA